MTGREKILLSFMAACLLGGVGYLYLDSSAGQAEVRGRPATGPSDANAFAQQYRDRLVSMSLSDEQFRQLSLATQAWDKNPFLPKQGRQAPPKEKPELAYRYSGYLQMEGNRYALIDGWEYQVGDLLKGDECRVTEIDPAAVTAKRLSDGKVFQIGLSTDQEK